MHFTLNELTVILKLIKENEELSERYYPECNELRIKIEKELEEANRKLNEAFEQWKDS